MKKGYTLIEILVVVTIIGLLAAVTSITYSQLSKQSRDAKRKADLEQIRAALEMYRSNNNSYPIIAISCSSSGGLTDASSTYLSSIPKDPQCSTKTYYYRPLDVSGATCSGTEVCTNYTLAAQTEVAGTTCVASQCGSSCNYCLDAYGQK